jgi:alkanesulfonate monooxygenase SsuD/methylene tetrahydromethanopterin reductase-like flavin-dependent oxidoreductase (luciferase family)
MRLGLFMMPLHPPSRALHDTLAEDTEKALLADRLGFDELWVGEHFSAHSEPIPSPLMFMASLINQTRNLTFCTGVITLPHRHPAVIAAEAAQFDHMSRGRFCFGIGAGSLPSDFELLGTFDEGQRGRMVLESMEMIGRIWTEEPPYDMQGEFWRVHLERSVTPEIGFGALPRPFQAGGPPVFVPAVSAHSRTVLEAGRRGWHAISSALPLPDVLATQWTSFVEGCQQVGRTPDPTEWRVVRTVLVAETDAEARARLFHADSAHRYFYNHLRTVLGQVGRVALLKPRPDMSDAETTVDAIMESRVIYGSPATVTERLAELRGEVGPFGTLVVSAMDWSGPNQAWERENMQRIAEEVMPALRQRCGTRVAA